MVDPWTKRGGCRGLHPLKPPHSSASQSICVDSHVLSRSMKAAIAPPDSYWWLPLNFSKTWWSESTVVMTYHHFLEVWDSGAAPLGNSDSASLIRSHTSVIRNGSLTRAWWGLQDLLQKGFAPMAGTWEPFHLQSQQCITLRLSLFVCLTRMLCLNPSH